MLLRYIVDAQQIGDNVFLWFFQLTFSLYCVVRPVEFITLENASNIHK